MRTVKSHLKANVCTTFSSANLQRIAVKCGFYKRSSKMLPSMFFDLLLHSASTNGQCSLGQLSGEAELVHDLSISKQGIDARIGKTAVSFVKGILEEVVARQIDAPLDADFLAKFNQVRIKDATRFDLPSRLKEHFPGFGGKVTSDAGVSIQLEFDAKNAKLHDLDIASARKTDIQDAKEKKEDVEKGDLIIRDLGYFSSAVLRSVIEKEAFFLTRLKSKMKVYGMNGEELSFRKLHQGMVKSQQARQHLQVTIGEKERIPVRLHIELVPEAVCQERIRKREKENKKKGYKTSEAHKVLARFNLMVTNAKEEDLPAEHVYQLYRMRWQVELLFKTWKSTMGINNVHPMRYHRLMCLLYAKLILFLVNSQVTALFVRNLYGKHKKHLSTSKCLKTLQSYFSRTREALSAHRCCLTRYVRDLSRLLSKNHWLEKKKNRMGYAELFGLFVCNSSI